MNKYTIIESKIWQHASGRTASIYGAIPWFGDEQKKEWKLVSRGWTVRNESTGIVGIGKVPWKNREDAEAWIRSLPESKETE